MLCLAAAGYTQDEVEAGFRGLIGWVLAGMIMRHELSEAELAQMFELIAQAAAEPPPCLTVTKRMSVRRLRQSGLGEADTSRALDDALVQEMFEGQVPHG
jgi:hypothetical protein